MTRRLSYLIILVAYLGCIEPIEFENEITTFESLLVIEATLTDEIKKQTVLLSRSSSFSDQVPLGETGASVTIVSDAGDTFAFEEQVAGIYVSVNEFSAMANQQYQLQITSADGKRYASETVSLVGASEIDSVYAERSTNNTGNEGVAIFVDANAETNEPRFYRYEYEETYRIIAPNWGPSGFNVFINEFGQNDFDVRIREEEQRVCYNTVRSNTIIQADTEDLATSDLSRFGVRFIDRNNFIISHRYSILVKQILQTREANDFFKQLERFSNTESVFSNVQPGFIDGNITELTSETPVIGFFSVVSVAEKRLFFNYEDFYSGEALPPYPFDCNVYVPSIFAIEDIWNNRVSYVGDNDEPQDDQLPYFVTARPCGDCTALGSNQVPDFWIE